MKKPRRPAGCALLGRRFNGDRVAQEYENSIALGTILVPLRATSLLMTR